jgi:7,8-dihydropterin-6-yl-methyl-4-(beta-D-ribofuranosyl)aminobenzene 5'-phosphate synthase
LPKIIGGLHLAGKEYAERIPLTVDFLSNKMKPSPSYILPMHCSGFQAKIALEKAFGDGCIPCSTGMKMELWADRSMDDRLYCPSY